MLHKDSVAVQSLVWCDSFLEVLVPVAQAWCQHSFSICLPLLVRGTWELLLVLCGWLAASQRYPSGPLLLLLAPLHHHHLPLHPSAEPFVPRVASCKQTCSGPEAHKGSLKSNGGNMYQYKYQTYCLDRTNSHKHSQMFLKFTAFKEPEEIRCSAILWIICSRTCLVLQAASSHREALI